MRAFAAVSPPKRAMERFVLGYSVLWIAAVAVVMLTRALATWGEGAYLAFGIALAAPVWVLPVVLPSASERARPFFERHSTRFNLFVGVMSFVQCAYGSWLFFDVLGMEYHFPVRWAYRGTPIFLYFMTVAYFTTYYVVMSVAWRAFRRRWPAAGRVARAVVLVAIGYAVAFAETAGMANDLLREWFLYRDKGFTLAWGSLCYGTVFVASLPFLFRYDEDPAAPSSSPPLWRVLAEALAANAIALVAYLGYAALHGALSQR